MTCFFHIFVAALLLTQAFAVPSASLETPCPEKTTAPTPVPTPCAGADMPNKYSQKPKSAKPNNADSESTDANTKYTDSNNVNNRYTESNNADSKYTESNNVNTKYTEASNANSQYGDESKSGNYGESTHPGARTYPGQVNRDDAPAGQFHTMGVATPSPTPSRIPDAVAGSSISLENTVAGAVGSNTLTMGAEAGAAALSGNTENGDNAIFGAVQPGGAFGFLGPLGGMLGASPSPVM